jgi:PAS domain S-box-containing protein
MKKVLVVDNHTVMLKLMADLLEKEGNQVYTAGDGLSALNVLKTYIPDVIFVDLVMPNISGEKLCRIIRSMPKLKDVCLVILSAIAAEEEVDFGELGADACIAKGPFDKMARHVLDVLEQSDLGDSRALSKEIRGLEDIYERKITQELLSYKRHFEAVMGNISEGILQLTVDDKIVDANPTAISLIGVQEEKLLGSNFSGLFHGADREIVKNMLKSVDQTRDTITKDSLVILNGKQISLSILPVEYKGQRSVIVIANDVGEQERKEAQRHQVDKMEALGVLADGIANDFETLLMKIQGNNSLMLLDVDVAHPHYERLKGIEQFVKSGVDLTTELLGFAKRSKSEGEPTDLNRMIKKISSMYGDTKREIKIHGKYQRDLWTAGVEQGQIERVLLSLYDNGRYAMPGGGDLYVETINVNLDESYCKPYHIEPGKYVKISITDTGVGMDKATQRKIFDPFFSTKEMGRGTGLGLASVYGIIRNHGGMIFVYSEKGRGTTFSIYLRACEEDLR